MGRQIVVAATGALENTLENTLERIVGIVNIAGTAVDAEVAVAGRIGNCCRSNRGRRRDGLAPSARSSVGLLLGGESLCSAALMRALITS